MKRNIRVLQVKFEVLYTLAMLWFMQKLIQILISTILITTRCHKVFLRASHPSSLKRLTKTVQCTPEHVTKVTVTEK